MTFPGSDGGMEGEREGDQEVGGGGNGEWEGDVIYYAGCLSNNFIRIISLNELIIHLSEGKFTIFGPKSKKLKLQRRL